MSSIHKSSGTRAVVFGEVLWDCFDDGTEVLGGAPFNVAWNLRGLGHDPLFVSRIGDDDRGARILDAMNDWGLDPSGMERDPARPTGRVSVSVRDGSPQFHIEPDQAYDAVTGEGAAADPGPGEGASGDAAAGESASTETSLLYHGSLILRTAPARETLRRLRNDFRGPVFLDVNLREPWWEPAAVRAMLDDVDSVKLNDEELTRLAPPNSAGRDWTEQAAQLRDVHRLSRVIVTRGAEGAALFEANRDPQHIPATPVSDLVDTVGAGDAFASVCMVGLLEDWPPEVTLNRAGRFAARICSLRGATTRDRSFYVQAADEWRDDASS